MRNKALEASLLFDEYKKTANENFFLLPSRACCKASLFFKVSKTRELLHRSSFSFNIEVPRLDFLLQ